MDEDIVINQPSCADVIDGDALAVDEATRRINALINVVTETELLPIRDTIGRILAEDIFSTRDVPGHTNSAVDGYAIAAEDPQHNFSGLPTACSLTIVGTAFAGQPFKQKVQAGQCVRVMTGAKMPLGTDTVIMQEHVLRDSNKIKFNPNYKRGQNVRQAGEDLKNGQIAIAAGKKMTPAELGMLASLGIAEVNVTRKLRVAFFSTGNELRSLGETLGEGEIYDSNRYTLYGMLSQLPVDINDLGVIADEPRAIRDAFLHASDNADVVITTGGVSVGEADYIKQVIRDIGNVDFWKLAIKPGRPLAFGKINNAILFGLPGNPVAVMVTFYQFVQPTLKRIVGQVDIDLTRFKVICESELKKKPGRVEYYRGILSTDTGGRVTVHKAGKQGSGILSTMSKANCFIVLAADRTNVQPGQLVDVQPFEGLL